MQLKVSSRYKDDAILKLHEEKSFIQNENLRLRSEEAAREAVLSTLREELARETLAKSNIQLELSSKEKNAQQLQQQHQEDMNKLGSELESLLELLYSKRCAFDIMKGSS
eukprot:CAMPEP_0185021004 /NCGR_PEP_ID=MMETSP1103-20130426/3665_1 /TAXON_ID=36769 /ORGANISM="Paraphysomonas bandaiensis, Strain Caron Lab Isolate" /LENGTH=109 /DNA_ID=CAMNT_0027552271 /DNA_START=267 /DNA_END=596 /DNA_ORIENTATION=+